MDERPIVEKLRKIVLFQAIKDDDKRLAKLSGIVSVRHCKAGHNVITEGDAGSEFFILNKGTVDVFKRTLDNDAFTIVTLTDEEDVFFGELALMDEELRSASVTANMDCEFLVINRDDFNRLGDEDPWLGLLVTRAIGRAVSRRLRKTNEDLIILFEALVGEVDESGNLEEPGKD
ncbi:MAG: cyclic nucleotide-binding domain-containing protein [Desulfobacterales bacterium]|nr:MAG: cyclic nucleotide-binding domain-containing protein [Desulfobacterales bacterium]